MMKIGVVTVPDPASCRCRVRFADHDQIESYWLPVLQGKTLRDKQYWMPDVNEHVVCLMDDAAEFGVILGAIYSGPDPVPVVSQDKYHVRFDDTATVEYDRAEHILSVYTPGRITVRADGDITVDSGADINATAAGDILARAGGNAEVVAAGDVACRAGRNAEVRGTEICQVICEGPILIKSNTKIVLKTPSRRIEL